MTLSKNKQRRDKPVFTPFTPGLDSDLPASVEFEPIVEEEIEEVEEVVPENSGPAAPLMEKQDEPATPRLGNCPNCGHKATSEVGLMAQCINCSRVVKLK